PVRCFSYSPSLHDALPIFCWLPQPSPWRCLSVCVLPGPGPTLYLHRPRLHQLYGSDVFFPQTPTAHDAPGWRPAHSGWATDGLRDLEPVGHRTPNLVRQRSPPAHISATPGTTAWTWPSSGVEDSCCGLARRSILETYCTTLWGQPHVG